MVDAEILSHADRALAVSAAHPGREVAVDVAFRDARVEQRPPGGLRVVPDGIEVRGPGVIAQPNADNDWSSIGHGADHNQAVELTPTACRRQARCKELGSDTVRRV